MKAESRFLAQPKSFWAYVRSVSEKVGYTTRKDHTIKEPTLSEIVKSLGQLSLNATAVIGGNGKPTPLGSLLIDYFHHRAEVLNRSVSSMLMDAPTAKSAFEALVAECKPEPNEFPWNKQKGDKKTPAYLTAIVNMLVKRHAKGIPFVRDPRTLTTITRGGKPIRTLARRVDGAFPTIVNPIAVWEIKEYYYTTTFGSRVADGVYESLLDGMELEELREHEKINVKHYLIVDGRYTWWDCGRSYLCRIVDMIHMGYLDEALFGREALTRLPELVKSWVTAKEDSEKKR